jgi:hypothetical protein
MEPTSNYLGFQMVYEVKLTLHPTLRNIRITVISFLPASFIVLRVCDVTFIRLFFATRESIDCYITLFGKNYPNSLNPSGGDLFVIRLHIGVSIGVSVRLTSFAT